MSNKKDNAFLKASENHETDLEKITYKGQDKMRRMYRRGYESFMNAMPVLDTTDEFLDQKVEMTKNVMKRLASYLRADAWVKDDEPGENGFNRTILALEAPKPRTSFSPLDPIYTDRPPVEEGTEIIMARWGDGHSSPVHGHAIGYLHEEILFGKMRVNIYRMINVASNIVRLVRTDMVTSGTFASLYTKPNPLHKFKRQTLIHNFTSVGFSATLHYLPEHTRDGRDNRFEVEFFEDWYKINDNDVTRINSKEGMYLQKGDVVLVRSTNVPEYGDHYIVVTGSPVLKDHGLRPQDVALYAPNTKEFLDQYELETGLVLLKFNNNAKESFLEFHDIKIEKGEVIFPDSNAEVINPAVIDIDKA